MTQQSPKAHGGQVVAGLNALAGNTNRPRTILPENTRKGEYRAKSRLSEISVTQSGECYANDVTRFGYVLDKNLPRGIAPLRSAGPIETTGRTFTLRVQRKLGRG